MHAKKMKLRKIGNSQGLILPSEILEELGLTQGSEIELSIEENAIVIIPPPPSLDDLIATVPKGHKFTEIKVGRKGIEE